MSKWNHDTLDTWRQRVSHEARRIAILANTGQLVGPDLETAITALVLKASERKPKPTEYRI